MMRIVGYPKVRAVGKIRKNCRSRAYTQSDRIMGTLTMRILDRLTMRVFGILMLEKGVCEKVGVAVRGSVYAWCA
jgi:hypothetical protein